MSLNLKTVNRYVTICNLQRKVGVFAEGNVKICGKNLLLKAGDRSQPMMLFKFKPQSGGDIKNITPHKYFDTIKGIFSSDLCEFEEPEIIALCPETVYEGKKLGGVNDAILLFFNCPLPLDIRIDHGRIKIKKFKAKPTQCHNCYKYGHIHKYCPNEDSTTKCKVCSSVSLCKKKLVERKNSVFTVTAVIFLQVGGVPGTGLRKKLLKLQTVSTSS